MNSILRYIGNYFIKADKQLLLFCSLLTATLVFLNYYYRVDDAIAYEPNFSTRFFARYVIFFIAFGGAYALHLGRTKKYFFSRGFGSLLFIAPAIFSLKAGLGIYLHLTSDKDLNNYWNQVIYWPVLLILTVFLLLICWKVYDSDQPFYGSRIRGISCKPYWLILLIMTPLIGLASIQPDFQEAYPKLKLIMGYDNLHISWWHAFLFELSYGSDFIGIELFFRGFLVLAFARWVGKDSILPMACFYCTIHFGKPLGECISSYFGGLLLGIVIFNTRSIWGGLMVHLGIAWLMELGGVAVVGGIRVAGCGMRDAGYWILDTGCWILLDVGYWMLDTGCWILNAGYYWILDA